MTLALLYKLNRRKLFRSIHTHTHRHRVIEWRVERRKVRKETQRQHSFDEEMYRSTLTVVDVRSIVHRDVFSLVSILIE